VRSEGLKDTFLNFSNETIYANMGVQMADEERSKETISQKFLGYGVAVLVIIAGFGGYQYYELRGSVEDTVQEMLKGYPGVTVDGINLPISVIFANKVTADVFIQRDNKGVVGDDVVVIEVSIIPKNAIPIVSIFGGLEFYAEISGSEMLKLGNY